MSWPKSQGRSDRGSSLTSADARLALERGLDRRVPRGHRPEIAPLLDRGQARRLDAPLDVGRQVADRAGLFSRRQELQTGIVCRYR